MTTVTDLRYCAAELFRDVKKAFDSVNHKVLLSKHVIMENYLSDRKQYVQLAQHKSQLQDITVGVPRGSNLGPKLF